MLILGDNQGTFVIGKSFTKKHIFANEEFMEKTKRQSNFELLRIFAMFMIILHHIQVHGSQVLLTADSGYFAQPIIYLRLLVFEIGVSLGSIGNGLFIMISGYFMNANDHIDTGKIAKKLLLQLGFATVILIIAYSVWITYFKSETLSLSMIAIEKFNSSWWFIGYYFSIIVLAKLFLNRFKIGRASCRERV